MDNSKNDGDASLYKPDVDDSTDSDSNDIDPSEMKKAIEPIQWNASEFIANQKSKNWFLLLAILILGIAVAVYFLTGSIFSAVIVMIVGIIFAIVAARKPQTINYSLNTEGLQMGGRFYPYDGFKSFSVFEEGATSSIRLNPFKRFSTPVNIYYEQADEQKIFDMISEYLPHEEASKDPIDQLMHKIRY